MNNHIVFCGRRGAGKTTMIRQLTARITRPVYGFQTRIMQQTEDGFHRIYMYPAGSVDGRMEADNHIGDCDTRRRSVHLSVFDDLGTRLVESAKPDGVLVMDEIGFMEIGAERFCRAVLAAVDSDLPILAAVKAGDLRAEFLDRIRYHPRTELFFLDRERFDGIYDAVLPEVLRWNE